MGKTTQCDKVIKYIKDKGSITQLDAMREFGIMRLASRIADLKDRGFLIDKQSEIAKNRYGEKVRYARYYLRKAKDDIQTGD